MMERYDIEAEDSANRPTSLQEQEDKMEDEQYNEEFAEDETYQLLKRSYGLYD